MRDKGEPARTCIPSYALTALACWGTRPPKGDTRFAENSREGRPMALHTGRHFLQIPGPTNIPDRVLRAMDMPALDHRGPEFAELGFAVFSGMQRIFRTKQPVIIFPSSGTGAWEAAIVNTLSPGDKVLLAETGQFAVLWKRHRREVQARPRIPADRLAPRRRRRRDRGAACRRPSAHHQGRAGRPQRDLDQLRHPSAGRSQSPRIAPTTRRC